MSPARKKATSSRHALAKRAAKRSRNRRKGRSKPKRDATPPADGGRARTPVRASAKSARRPGEAKREGRPGGTKNARRPGKAKRAGRPSLAAVARPKRTYAPLEVTEFSGARANASAKDLALFRLERARVAVSAAIQGMTAGVANRPIAPGKWSVRQMVLHLAFWDREVLARHLEPAAARGQRASIARDELETMNAAGVAALEHHDWEEARRLLQAARERLWDALESIPAEPAGTWLPDHPVGDLIEELTTHDRHHAETIKRWREQSGAQKEGATP